jgi:Xaa-Pro dipeptidase
LPLSVDEALSLYDVDQVLTTDQVASALAHPHSSSAVWAIANQVSDHITFLEFNEKDFSLLKLAIEECRVIKDEYEVALTRHANDISTIAHTAVLKAVKHAKNERELEALFIAKSISHGAREQAYHSIVASMYIPIFLSGLKCPPSCGTFNSLETDADSRLSRWNRSGNIALSEEFRASDRKVESVARCWCRVRLLRF